MCPITDRNIEIKDWCCCWTICTSYSLMRKIYDIAITIYTVLDTVYTFLPRFRMAHKCQLMRLYWRTEKCCVLPLCVIHYLRFCFISEWLTSACQLDLVERPKSVAYFHCPLDRDATESLTLAKRAQNNNLSSAILSPRIIAH